MSQESHQFNQLITAVKNCTLCRHELPLEPNAVFQVSAQSRVLIVGQAPGIRAHESGLPFDDPSGDRLRSWLGVSRETFYDSTKFALLPMAFCFPGTGKSGDLPPPRRCADTWRKQLLDKLHFIRFTLLCGRYAIDWHCPCKRHQPLAAVVQRQYQTNGNLLVTPHPSGRNNGWFATHTWFDATVVPAIRAKVAQAISH